MSIRPFSSHRALEASYRPSERSSTSTPAASSSAFVSPATPPSQATVTHNGPAANRFPTVTITRNGKVYVPRMFLVLPGGRQETPLTRIQQAALKTKIDALLARADLQPEIAGKEVTSINLHTLCINVKGGERPVYIYSDMKEVMEIRDYWRNCKDPNHKHQYLWTERLFGQRSLFKPGKTQPAYQVPTHHLQNLDMNDIREAKILGQFDPAVQVKGLKRRHAANRLRDRWDEILEDLKARVPADQAERIQTIEKAQSKMKGMSDFALRFEMAYPIDANDRKSLTDKRDAAFEMITDPSTVNNPSLWNRFKNKVQPSWVQTPWGEAKEKINQEAAAKLANDIALQHLELLDPKNGSKVPMRGSKVLEFSEGCKVLGVPETMDSFQAEFTKLAKAVGDGNAPEIDTAVNPVFAGLLHSLTAADRARVEAEFRDSINEIQADFANADLETRKLNGIPLPVVATDTKADTNLMVQDFNGRMRTPEYERLRVLNLQNQRNVRDLNKLIAHYPRPFNQGQVHLIKFAEQFQKVRNELTELNHKVIAVPNTLSPQELKDARSKEFEIQRNLEVLKVQLAAISPNIERFDRLVKKLADNQKLVDSLNKKIGKFDGMAVIEHQDDLNNLKLAQDALGDPNLQIHVGSTTHELDVAEPQAEAIRLRLLAVQSHL